MFSREEILKRNIFLLLFDLHFSHRGKKRRWVCNALFFCFLFFLDQRHLFSCSVRASRCHSDLFLGIQQGKYFGIFVSMTSNKNQIEFEMTNVGGLSRERIKIIWLFFLVTTIGQIVKDYYSRNNTCTGISICV